MNFKKVNNITGWIVCIIACTVYILTREATGSFWDCGEFISSAYKVQIPHPPGAPLFILLGRLFIIIFGGSINAVHASTVAASKVNLLSAVSSGFTILFLFWSVTYFAKRLMLKKDEIISRDKMIAIMAAGVVGALAYTFSDSFWFSAVEGEVYGMSSFFTALVFWAMLKWDNAADDPNRSHADRWIIFTFYMMGLSIGVHLLCLLVIPAITMIYYFRRYKVTQWGTFYAFVIGCILTGFVQVVVIQYSVKLAAAFDIFFVNSLGMPFNSGAYTFIILLAILVFLGIRWSIKKRYYLLQMGLLCFTFLMFGYATYFTTLIRSNANPAIDMFNVDNPVSLLGYLNRTQYGDWPILYGPDFNSQILRDANGYPVTKNKGTDYEKVDHKYEVSGNRIAYEYQPGEEHLFPRVWDSDNAQGHADFYQQWLNLSQGEKPSFGDNINWFLTYQVGWMYGRYFMWNFSGRQNDTQGFGNVRDGNWITGIPFIDNARLGDQSKMPDSLKENKAHNRLFALPLILGIIGLFFQINRSKRDTLVNFLLFFFTGLAIVIYLNQAGNQPRERDYAYVGSFYAFAIWIGLGVLSIYNFFKRKMAGVSAAGLAGIICLLAVPVLMAFQEWDDHDRSQKTLPRDVAKDYLESCAPNAILFTVGDNDTYPLWYAQEVEGIRTDVRIINLSLLGVDWYINEMRYKINKADAVPMTWTPDKYFGDRRNYIQYVDPPSGTLPKDKYFNIKEVMNFMGSDDTKDQLPANGSYINYLPVKNLYIPVNKKLVLQNGTVQPKDSAAIVPQIEFTLNTDALLKNDLLVLDIIAADNWQRPIYFTSPYSRDELGLNDFLETNGLTYRLVPLKADNQNQSMGNVGNVNADKMYPLMIKKFGFGGANLAGTYFDEPNRRMLLNIRNAYAKEGIALAMEGKKDSALKALNLCDKNILQSDFPYALTSPNNMDDINSMQTVYAYYVAGDTVKAESISNDIIQDCRQQINFYTSLSPQKLGDLQNDQQRAAAIIQQLQAWQMLFGHTIKGSELPLQIDSNSIPADSSSAKK